MESCATPKTSPRWRKRNLFKEKAQRKRHCASTVTSREPVQETAAATSRPSENTAREDNQDQEDIRRQENADSGADVAESKVIMERLREWISVELERDNRKKVAVLLVQVCIQVGLRVKEASAIAGELVGKTERTVREWRQDFFRNQGCFSEYQRGKYVRPSIIDDEAARKDAVKFVRENAQKRGTKYDCWHVLPVG